MAAQTQTTGDVAGTVTDASGAVVPNAKVVLRSNDRGSSQDGTTNKDGVYRFSCCRPVQAPVGDVSNPALFGSVVRTVSPPTTVFGSGLGADASARLVQAKLLFTF